jgi:hypothetical protein
MQPGQLQGPFEKFVDPPYYSESELCGGAVTVSFSKYLPWWQAMYFLQRSTYFSKTRCRPFAASFRRIVEQAVLTSELHFHGWKSPEIACGEIWTVWRMNEVPPVSMSIATFQLRTADAPLKFCHPKNGSLKTTVTLFSRSGWSVVRSASLVKGGTLKKRPSPHLHKVPTRRKRLVH